MRNASLLGEYAHRDEAARMRIVWDGYIILKRAEKTDGQ